MRWGLELPNAAITPPTSGGQGILIPSPFKGEGKVGVSGAESCPRMTEDVRCQASYLKDSRTRVR